MIRLVASSPAPPGTPEPLLERVGEMGHDVEAMLVRAMRPKVKVIAHSPGFDAARNALFKSNGFRFEPKTKEWWKMVPADDAAARARHHLQHLALALLQEREGLHLRLPDVAQDVL